MTWNLFMHCAGVVCLVTMAGCGAWSLFTSLVPNWARIWDTACGRPWPIARHPVSPTASVLPLRTFVPTLRAVEADAQLTVSKHAA